MDYHDHPFYTERFESRAELREAQALSFTAEDMADWDEDDHEAASLAMGRDMAERAETWQDENAILRAEINTLRAQLAA